MHTLTGIIKNRHIVTLKKRADYLDRIVAADAEQTKPFQSKELYAIKAVLLCAKEVPETAEKIESD